MSARVITDDPAFGAALAELPRSAAAGGAVEGAAGGAVQGAVVVHAGGGPLPGTLLGAVGLVLASPGMRVPDALPDVPVIVHRARLRADAVADAVGALGGIPPRSVVVECSASADETAEVLRDAVGWARVLAGGDLELIRSTVTARAIAVQLRRGGTGTPVTVLLARRDGSPAWIRGLAVDSVRVEVLLEHATRAPRVERTDAGGRLRLPERYESSERVAVRRVLAAVAAGEHPADVRELEHDVLLASRALMLKSD